MSNAENTNASEGGAGMAALAILNVKIEPALLTCTASDVTSSLPVEASPVGSG
ncbi:MAG: hypothetical protein WAQ33_06625 [Gaiellaceae bacterium]